MLTKRWFKSVFVQDQLQQLQADLLADSVFDGAAALSYFFTLAIFPGLIFAVTLLPYLSIPNLDSILSHDVLNYLPSRAALTVQSTLVEVLREPNAGLMSLSFLGGLFAASSGLVGIMRQMNIANEIRETRSFFHVRGVAILITILLTLVLLCALIIIVMGGLLFPDSLLTIMRWIVSLVTVYTGISLLYYVAPDNSRVHRAYKYLSPGCWLATVMILLSTKLLSVYLSFFDSYNKIYGSLAGVIVLMIWFYLIGVALLMGAQLNHFCREKYWMK